MELTPAQFLRTWVIAVFSALTLVGAYDGFLDPYKLTQMREIARLNERKPAIDTQQDLIKTYDVLRAAPHTLVLGSSQVALGLDARYSAALAHRSPGYNLGVARGGIYAAYRYLQHVSARDKLDVIVLGIEFSDFLALPHPVPAGFESRLAVRPDGSINPGTKIQHAKDLLWGLFSFEAFTDSVLTLWCNASGDSSDFSAGYWDYKEFHPGGTWVGNTQLFKVYDLGFARTFSDLRLDPDAMRYMARVLDLAQDRKAHLIIVLNPSHADELEMLNLAGQWQTLEGWKRELVSLASRYGRAGGVEIWDFCDYSRYASEAMPEEGRLMQWFLNPVHYSPRLGNLMLERVFGKGHLDFGVPLTPENLEGHLADIRAERRGYLQRNTADVRRLQTMFNLALGLKPFKDD